jgi:magnesium-transporting ATPase (P-type)
LALSDDQGNVELHSVDTKQLLLQGTVLRNTDFIYGLAVYTGNETKLGMNKHKPPIKLTQLDARVDRTSRVIFGAQLAMVLMLGIAGNIHGMTLVKKHSYLFDADGFDSAIDFFIIPIRMLLLLSFMIPISLKVTLDMTKYIAALFIDWVCVL